MNNLKKITRKDLADKLGISLAALGRKERGKSQMREDKICEAAVILKCNCSEIIGENRDER